MFSNKANIQNLTAEVLVHLAAFLEVATLLQLSLTCKAFGHVIKDELVFRRLTERDYHVVEKTPKQSWVQLYKELRNGKQSKSSTHKESKDDVPADKQETMDSSNATADNHTKAVKSENHNPDLATDQVPTAPITESTTTSSTSKKEGECPHLTELPDLINEVKRIIYRSGHSSVCDLCSTKEGTFLNMHIDNHNEACLSCLNQSIEDEDHFPIQLELETGDLYCFKCGNPHKLTEEEDGEKVKTIVEYLKTPESDQDLDKRRKAEHQLYVQELRREDMQIKHYLVEKQWGRTWMLFRTREGSPLPTRITNQKLARVNGTLDPNIRLPMDKYRPSPETHGDIVSEKLWRYLEKAYGVQGRAYNEDDIIAPEYARLRVYVDDFKKSIHLYP